MKKIKKVFCVVIVSMLLATAVQAAEKLAQPKVEYSADTYFETEEMSFSGRTYQALNGKQRQEINMEGSRQITITRMDKKLIWVLMPNTKTYMEMSINEGKKESRDVHDCDVDQKNAGTETVNGVKATRSKVSMSCPDGQYTGDMWVTKEGIMVKMDAAGKAEGSKTVRMKTELKNLKIARQDPALFEIPAGYTKMSFGNPMSAAGLGATKKKPSAKQTQQNSGRDYTSQEPADSDSTAQQSENKVDNVDNAVRKVRGLFGF
ncbi:MAG: DUF4412 domain-containing protein [Nitrospirota bacterium]|nr:DUF4412 domain-containing protein [Nitrospirota bacterium]